MHFTTVTTSVFAALISSAAALSSFDVTNGCDDTKYLTLSTNENGVVAYNQILPSGTSRHYDIIGDHSLAVANSTDYWSPSTAKVVLGTNSVNGILYYAIGLANGNPIHDNGISFVASDGSCPSIYSPDGSTKGCSDNNVSFRLTLCAVVFA